MTVRTQCFSLVLLCLFGSVAASSSVQPQPAPPETVMATFRVKPDQLQAFLKMMPEYWKLLRDREMVDAEPHLLMQGEENGKPIVVQVLTWKSGDIPDHASAEVQAYWTRMNAMVETRDGHPGIDFPPMTLVDLTSPAK